MFLDNKPCFAKPSNAMQAAVQNTGTLSALQKTAVRSTMRQLAQAIAYTHQHGVTHRDIKPENVLLQDNGNIALCDFGISKDIISGAYESTVHLAAPAGTIAYCAPEAGDTVCVVLRFLLMLCLSKGTMQPVCTKPAWFLYCVCKMITCNNLLRFCMYILRTTRISFAVQLASSDLMHLARRLLSVMARIVWKLGGEQMGTDCMAMSLQVMTAGESAQLQWTCGPMASCC